MFKITIINLICLNVENAIIFFISLSIIAMILPTNIVITEIKNIHFLNFGLIDIGSIRIKRITPAVTKVEEWTKADTGVGAAIALGNQEEKGSWALFVNAAIVRNIIIVFLYSMNVKIDHDPNLNI